jgi:tetratricopeptide (TPR) repeat protein
MDNSTNFDTYLLENFEFILSVVAGEDKNLQTKLYMHYVVLKLELFQRWGRTEDLEEAIEKGKHAVVETQEENEAYAKWLNNLGVMLESRYECTGKMEDLEEAIRMARQAVDVTPEDHPDLAGRLNNLGNKLESRYERTGKMENLEEAIRIARQVVDVTPEDHPDLARRLNNLGSKLESRYERMGKMEDLEEAIRIAQQAVDVTPEDHPVLATLLNNLGNRLESQYERTGKMEDLEEAIRMARQAVDLTPEDHPDFAALLNNLGSKLDRRHKRIGKMEDLEEAIQVTQQAWKCKNAALFVRVRASTQALQLLQSRGDFESAYNLSVEAINLLPYVHNRSLDRQDQQYVVSHFSGLATTACSLALQTEQGPEAALDVLEQGRGVILSLLIDDRSDTSKLKAAYPQLCTQYESLRLEVNKPADNITDNHTRRTASTSQAEAITKLEMCVRDIQRLPEFGQFHKGLTTMQMQSCSAEGSIIIVNVTNLRSDAIIITTDVFRVLPLPGLSARQAKDWINQDLTTTSLSGRGCKNKAYLQFLSWLWRGCVRPVLEELHCYEQRSAEDLPRVWWIGTGLASSFPFHSAGDISVGLTENASYRAISSYTPTLKALQYARDRPRTSIPPHHYPWKVVIIAMPETPGASNLPGTRAERSEIIAAIEPFVSIKTLEYPDVVSTMAQLRECNIAHFACHGVSDSADPSSSGLILQTARTTTEEPRQDILSVHELFQAHLLRAEIAYLSACSTAQNRVIRLSDEVLYVVSGFQVAGFRHVVGCLWPSDDKVCVNIAKSFYSELSQGGTVSYDDRATALALHKAVAKIRESNEYCKRPLLWAQYMHFGA